MLLSNYFKWRLGMEDYVAVVTEGSAQYKDLGMKNTDGQLQNILVSSNNNSSIYSVGNKNRMFSEGVGVILSTSDTEYTKDAYMLGNTIASWITGLNIQYSDVVEDGKLTRIFTISGQNITQNASVKAIGITKTLYGANSASYNYLMAIYEPEEPIQLTTGQGFSFSFKWTEE